MMNKKIAAQLIVIALLTVSLIAITELRARPNSVFSKLALITDVRDYLVREYVEEPDQQEMMENAVRGMIASLDDPYTNYISQEEQESFETQITGSFTGIGAEVEIHQKRLRIVTPLEGSPAWKAGVLAGDIVMKIGEETTLDLSLYEAISKLKGPKGTDVTITVRHKSGEQEELTITRDKINIKTARGFKRNEDHTYNFFLDDDNKIGYIRLTQFNKDTTKQTIEAITQLKDNNVKAIILDLRFNPGGLLSSAVEISDLFLPEGQRIVSTKGRVVPEIAYNASDRGTLVPDDISVVVIANEASASASEIVTGALSDNGRALFVGTRTYGKGSVQDIRDLAGNLGTLKYTNAYYYLPNGRNIHKREGKETWGVDPSEGCYVRMTPKQIEAMIEVRRETDVILKDENTDAQPKVTPDWIENTLKDIQLAAALEAALGKLETGNWPQVGESNVELLVLESKRANLEQRKLLLQDTLDEIGNKIAELDDEINGLASPATTSEDAQAAAHSTPASDTASTEAPAPIASTTEPAE
ncbi:S41 family peptidase [Poriferisphaera sp. WC338]|uniref:S41 family peptidase n=1 Tax=Poriferisphaera sp. WC338 TaxID=3425129 RepID=UPI003D817B02